MLVQLFLQIALASTSTLSIASQGDALTHIPAPASRVVAGPDDRTALDILNKTRPDILARGVEHGCPAVESLYIDGKKWRKAPTNARGFSTAMVYVAHDKIMIMLPLPIADALRTVPARDVHDIQYVDCAAPESTRAARNALFVTTK